MRPFTIADLGPMHELYSDPDATRYTRGPSSDVEESARRLQRLIDQQDAAGFSIWAVVERSELALIGYCGLVPYAYRGPDIEIAYGLRVPFWGKGYATEAARAWIAHGFDELGLDRIVGVAHPDNEGSLRVLEKIGMRREGERDYDGERVLAYAIERSA